VLTRIMTYRLILLIVLMFCSLVSNAASLIDSSITRYSLGKDLLYLKEEGATLLLSQILKPEFRINSKKLLEKS